MGCLVAGYFPEPVTVQWNSGANGIQTFPPLFDSSRGHYMLSSQLTVPVSKWKSDKFQCSVAHPFTRSTVNKQIESCKSKDPVAPKVRLLHSSCSPESSSASIELVCFISGFYPKHVTVEWLVGGQSGLLPSVTGEPRKDASGHTFSTISTATIKQSDWQEKNAYICQVTHAAAAEPLRSKAKICEGSFDIRTFILPPNANDLYMTRQSTVTCVVNNLESDAGLEVTWSREKGPVTPEPLQTREELNGTLTATSSLVINVDDWLVGEAFTCTVNLPGLLQPITVSANKKTEPSVGPNVYLFRPHHEELSSRDQYVSITALVKGFTPNDISLKWLKNGNPLAKDDYMNTPVFRDSNDSYFLFSKLKVPKTDWNRGDSYTCMVIHEGLHLKFIQKNIEKSHVIIISTEIDHSNEIEDELESLWSTILVFFILFLLSVCYNATMTFFKVKWLFTTVVQLKKQPLAHEYKNVIPQTA